MSPALLATLITLGSLTLVGVILAIVFTAVRRTVDRQMAALAGEGIVLDSGSVSVRVDLRGFRAPGVAVGVGLRMGPGRIVLTKRRMTFVPLGRNRYGFASMEREALARFQVKTNDGKLHLHSDNPPGASGTVDIFVAVQDPQAWVAALGQAGASTDTFTRGE